MRLGDLDALKKALEVTQYNDIDDLTRTERLIDNAPTVNFIISPDYVTELQNINKELIKQLEETERPQDNSICKNCFNYIDDNNYLGECVRCKYDYRNLAKLEDHFEQRGEEE